MSSPYVGEIRLFAGNFAPAGWNFCNGQLLPISENDTLFNLIGTTYGGDGQETFALPDLQGRVPVHMGSGPTTVVIGEAAGVESVTLTTNQIPSHSHAVNASTTAGDAAVATSTATLATMGPAGTTSTNIYAPYNAANAQVTLNNGTVAPAGGSQPHNNIQPTLAVSYIISLFGIYPQQS